MRIGPRSLAGALALTTALGITAALGLPRATLGHALLIASDPAAGTTVLQPPSVIKLTFGEPPDPGLSTVRVLDSAKHDQASGKPAAVPGDPTSLQVAVGTLGNGVYTVSWRTVSADDGHVTAGSFAFGVGAGTVVSNAPSTEGQGAPAGSPLAAVVRLLLYAGLAGLLGSGAMGLLLHPSPPRRLARFALGAWTVALAGTLGVVAIQWSDSGADLAPFLASAIGPGVIARVAVALLAGAVFALWRRGDRFGAATGAPNAQRWPFTALLVIGAAGVLVDVMAGHASAADQPWLAIGLQSVHGLAAGLWMGGLAALVVVIRGLPTDEKTITVRRYSTMAGILIVLVAGSGLARAIQQVGTVDAFLGTDFGHLVALKSALLVGLGAIGAVNRFVNVPAAAARLVGLRRWASAELGVGTLVFVVTALLVNAVPPVLGGTHAGQVTPVVAVGTDDASTTRVLLTVTPGTPGFNVFTAALASPAGGGSPPAATGVSLRFSLVSQTGGGQTTLDLASGGPDAFQGSGGNLSSDGIWQVTAIVATRSGTVDVPVTLATRVADEPVTSDPSIMPVIYTVRLPTGGTVQTYLDPGRIGTNDLHVTFFDAADTELPVATVTVAVASADLPGEVIQPRQLEPGHFVATLDLPTTGALTVDAVGPAPDGTQLHAYLVMEVAP